MSGGRLVVLDRQGRDVKYFPLQEGLATIGSDPVCDIRVLANVSPHHATVIVHALQTIIQSVSAGTTLVNGSPVSVAALRHCDEISVGGRRLRWEYSDPTRSRPMAPLPSLVRRNPRAVKRRATGPAAPRLLPPHRASMPAPQSGKQVAIVQPQRRDTNEQNEVNRAGSKRARSSRHDDSDVIEDNDSSKRWANTSGADTDSATKASMWIESRKKTPQQRVTLSNDITQNSVEIQISRNSSRNSGRNQTPARGTSAGGTPARAVHPPNQTSPARNSSRKSQRNIKTPVRASSRTPTHVVRTPARTPVHTPVPTPARTQAHAANTSVRTSGRKSDSTLSVRKSSQASRNSSKQSIQSPTSLDLSGHTSVRMSAGTTGRATGLSPTRSPARTPARTPVRTSARTPAHTPAHTPVQTPARTPGRKTQRASHRTLEKIQAPLQIDHTKQAAIKRMSGPRLLVARPSARPRPAPHSRGVTSLDSSYQNSSQTDISVEDDLSVRSPTFGSPKKSALKDPAARKSSRKTETIKFDLSNIENTANRSSDIVFLSETNDQSDTTESNLTLRYSESSIPTPSPRRSIHSRSSKILEKSGTPMTQTFDSEQNTLTPETSKRKSSRGTLILKKALENSRTASRQFRRTTVGTDQSYGSTLTSVRKTRSPRESNQNRESYSIVDLVSVDSDELERSVYDSIGSTSNLTFDTPETLARKTRSANISLLGSSTPYVKTKVSPKLLQKKSRTRRSTSELITPENVQKPTFNSTKISKASKSRSRLNESDIFLVDNDDASPRSSRRGKSSGISPRKNISITASSSISTRSKASPSVSPQAGMCTPENRTSPEDTGTPVLSIQSLLDQSSISQSSLGSIAKTKPSRKRKTTSTSFVVKKPRASAKSKSLIVSRQSRSSKKNTSLDSEEKIVTPKSGVTILQEAVKNKHSTAKQPQSKRSIIDNLNESDIVKQLFNSPVKRKLSQSMIEFSKKQLLDDDDIMSIRPTRKTIALTAKTPDVSLIDRSDAFTPEVFVSPLNTPSDSPNLTGIKRLYVKNSPENDLRNIRGVKVLLRTPRVRKSIKNDLSNVAGVKKVFARSPKNRLSDVRVKEIFAASPKNDLTRVSGVKKLYVTRKRKSPQVISPDVTGIRSLFKRSPRNDLGNVSGVKETLKARSPKNDLTSIKDIKHMFSENRAAALSDVSGVEELFDEPQNLNSTFDQLIGRPPVKSYVKSKSLVISKGKKSTRQTKSLHDSIDFITNNVEEWLEKELNKRTKSKETSKKSLDKLSNVTRELQKLATDTVEGVAPLQSSKIRNSTNATLNKTQSFTSRKKSASEIYSARKLPIKKRSLVEASVDKSGNRSINKLPIKKRVVVHSTPVKGRVNLTMNTTELGRVSPIAQVEKMDVDTTYIQTLQLKESPRIKPGRGKKTIEAEGSNTRTLPLVESPKDKRGRRKKTAEVEVINTQPNTQSPKKSLNVGRVRGKKTIEEPPILKESPKLKGGRGKKIINEVANTQVQPLKESPKSKRGRAKHTIEVEISNKQSDKVSPKKTRANARTVIPVQKPTRARRTTAARLSIKNKRASLTIAKKPPVLSPKPIAKTQVENETKSTRSVRQRVVKEQTPKTTRSKGVKASAVISPPKQTAPRQTRKTRTNNENENPNRKLQLTQKNENNTEENTKTGKKSTKENPKPQKVKGKIEVKEVSIEPRSRRVKATENAKVDSPVLVQRGRKVKIELSENTRNKRESKNKNTPTLESQTKRSRNKIENQTIIEAETKTRNRRQVKPLDEVKTQTKVRNSKSQTIAKVESPKPKRDRRKQVTFLEESTAKPVERRGRRNIEKFEAPEVLPKRGPKSGTVAIVEPKAKKVASPVQVKATRGKKVVPVEQSLPETKGRKRKTTEETSKEDVSNKKRKMSSSPAPRATRGRAAAAAAPRRAAAGSRRR